MPNTTHPLSQANAQRLLLESGLGIELVSLEQLEGGISATVQKMTYLDSGGQQASAVIRCHSDVDANRNAQLAADEFSLVQTLHALKHRVPKPLYLGSDPRWMGRPFVVYEFVDGHLVSDAKGLGDRADSLARWLATLHSQGADRYDLMLSAGVDRRPRQALRAPGAELDAEILEPEIRARLHGLPVPSSPAPEVVLHGDFWSGNVLWRGEELVAVIDWEDFGLGDPLADLACARLELLWGAGWRTMEAFTAHYSRASRWGDVDPLALAYWDLCAVLPFAHTLADIAPDAAQFKLHKEQLHRFVQAAMQTLGDKPHSG